MSKPKLFPLAGKSDYWARWLLVALSNAILWLLLAAKLSGQELAASLIAAVLACLGASVFQVAGRMRFRPTARALAEAWRIPGDLAAGIWQIFCGTARMLWKRSSPRGALQAARFEVGGDEPRSRARRALAVTYLTLTPNTVVLGFVEERNLILYHQFVPAEVPPLIESLGTAP